MRYLSSSLLFILLITGCGNQEGEKRRANDSSTQIQSSSNPVPTLASTFIEEIEDAHHAPMFFAHRAVAFDLKLSFAGKSRLTGRVTMLTNSTKVMVERNDGATVLFDGEKVYRYPNDTNWPRARFDVLTWMYFFAAPYKLGDPGSEMELLGRFPLDSDTCETGKLTFGDGVGDAPDDWYIIYKADSTSLLRAMAYIVTFGKSAEESGKAEPHAIVYSDYREVEGIPFAHRWTFTNWKQEEGVSGERGVAEISKVRFVENPEFTLPEGKVEVGM
ncbi:MAG: hypothetical protein KDD67_00635 [Ignavibacteriae bacterium]|nr:hypothetical protein [Ignavibacteriota bacterium]MCB9214657.1 hypothetical protein [Ignavibacteria bacterium]